MMNLDGIQVGCLTVTSTILSLIYQPLVEINTDS